MEKKTILELKNITKTFPGVKALDDVNIALKESSILALVGENGAGKSTLIKIITGVYQPNAGEIILNGTPVHFQDTHAAFDAGISVVHQERNLCETFTVAENLFLEQITRKATGVVDMKSYNKKAKQYLEMVGLNVDPSSSVTELSSGQQQLLEIARALSMGSKIIMLDEPTASISITESDNLLSRVESLKENGYSFIFVSHKLDEVFRVADDIAVIRDGKSTMNEHIAGSVTPELRDRVVIAMVGRAESKKAFPVRDKTSEAVVLEAKEIAGKLNKHKTSFRLHKGEIYGWYGLVGAGRTELARELIGVDTIQQGELFVNGGKAVIRNPKDAIEKYKIAYISENRNEEGVFVGHSICKNLSSSVLKKIAGFAGWTLIKKEIANADEYIQKLEIKTPSRDQLVLNLSGGNRQKVSVAKILATNPEILIIDEPSVGIDIKTKEDIHNIIVDLADAGISILLISSDLDEMIKVADRIAVFNEFKILEVLPNSKEYTEMSGKIMNRIMEG